MSFITGLRPGLRRHPDLRGIGIHHVHLQTIRKPTMEQAIARNIALKEGILAAIFTVPGDPDARIDFPPIFQALADHRLVKGWMMLEALQSPAKATPLVYINMGRNYLRAATGT